MLTTLAWTIKYNIAGFEAMRGRVPLEILGGSSPEGASGFRTSVGLGVILNVLANPSQ
jgi:hypothetical protein